MGIEKFKNILNKKISLALTSVASVALEESDKIIPIDTGFLANSKFSQLHNQNKTIRLGYTSKYAAKVHERQNQKFKRPNAENKFLEKGMSRTKDTRDLIMKKVLSV